MHVLIQRYKGVSRWAAVHLAFALCGAFGTCEAASEQDLPPARAVLLRVDGRQEAAQSIHQPLAPASLTKLALALVALESAPQRSNPLVTVSRASAQQIGSRLGLRVGERLRSDDLLAATLVASANDACHALAEQVAGSASHAVDQMNALAKRLGMVATVFKGPCGLDQPGQQSTAADLERLADAALRQPRILELTATRRMSITTAAGRTIELRSTNRLLGSFPGAVGLKTGYTSSAGRNLIALARREGVEVLLILMGAQDRWDSAEELLETGFGRARVPATVRQ